MVDSILQTDRIGGYKSENSINIHNLLQFSESENEGHIRGLYDINNNLVASLNTLNIMDINSFNDYNYNKDTDSACQEDINYLKTYYPNEGNIDITKPYEFGDIFNKDGLGDWCYNYGVITKQQDIIPATIIDSNIKLQYSNNINIQEECNIVIITNDSNGIHLKENIMYGQSSYTLDNNITTECYNYKNIIDIVPSASFVMESRIQLYKNNYTLQAELDYEQAISNETEIYKIELYDNDNQLIYTFFEKLIPHDFDIKDNFLIIHGSTYVNNYMEIVDNMIYRVNLTNSEEFAKNYYQNLSKSNVITDTLYDFNNLINFKFISITKDIDIIVTSEGNDNYNEVKIYEYNHEYTTLTLLDETFFTSTVDFNINEYDSGIIFSIFGKNIHSLIIDYNTNLNTFDKFLYKINNDKINDLKTFKVCDKLYNLVYSSVVSSQSKNCLLYKPEDHEIFNPMFDFNFIKSDDEYHQNHWILYLDNDISIDSIVSINLDIFKSNNIIYTFNLIRDGVYLNGLIKYEIENVDNVIGIYIKPNIKFGTKTEFSPNGQYTYDKAIEEKKYENLFKPVKIQPGNINNNKLDITYYFRDVNNTGRSISYFTYITCDDFIAIGNNDINVNIFTRAEFVDTDPRYLCSIDDSIISEENEMIELN